MTRYIAALGVALFACGCAHRSDLSYQSQYRQPLVSPGLVFLSLPAAVQNTIRAQAGMAEIADINRYDIHNSVFYKVWFAHQRRYPPLYIAPDGSVLNADLTIAMRAPVEDYARLASRGYLAVADLPSEVVKTIQARAKTQEIGRILESSEGDKRAYEVYFKNSKALPMIKIDQDGKLLESTPFMGQSRKPPL